MVHHKVVAFCPWEQTLLGSVVGTLNGFGGSFAGIRIGAALVDELLSGLKGLLEVVKEILRQVAGFAAHLKLVIVAAWEDVVEKGRQLVQAASLLHLVKVPAIVFCTGIKECRVADVTAKIYGLTGPPCLAREHPCSGIVSRGGFTLVGAVGSSGATHIPGIGVAARGGGGEDGISLSIAGYGEVFPRRALLDEILAFRLVDDFKFEDASFRHYGREGTFRVVSIDDERSTGSCNLHGKPLSGLQVGQVAFLAEADEFVDLLRPGRPRPGEHQHGQEQESVKLFHEMLVFGVMCND